MNQIAMNQAYLFMIFILNGAIIGIIFDIFRILRQSFKTPNIITYIEDVLFWLIATFSVIYSLFVFNNGEIRGYLFIGLFLGVVLYLLFFSKIIIKISVKIIIFVKQLIYNLLKIVINPLKILSVNIWKILNNIYSFLIKMSSIGKIKNKRKKKLEN